MTKNQAQQDGFCEQCAALWGGRQRCGVLAADKTLCQLDIETQARWIKEFNLKSPRAPFKKGGGPRGN